MYHLWLMKGCFSRWRPAEWMSGVCSCHWCEVPFLWDSIPGWKYHSWWVHGGLRAVGPVCWHCQHLRLMGMEICRQSSYPASILFSSSSHGNRLQENWAWCYLYPVFWRSEVCFHGNQKGKDGSRVARLLLNFNDSLRPHYKTLFCPSLPLGQGPVCLWMLPWLICGGRWVEKEEKRWSS